MSAIITHHAHERAGERLGLNAKAIRRTAVKALEKGLAHCETGGSLKRYCDKLFLTHRKATNMRIYGEHIWLFTGRVLLTVLLLPNELKATARTLLKDHERKYAS